MVKFFLKLGVLNLTKTVIFFICLFSPGKFAHAASYNASAVFGQVDYVQSIANIPDITSGLNTPDYSVLDDVGHRLFVSDMYNARVLVYNLDSNNNIVSSIPSNVLGQPNLGSNSPSVSQNGLTEPHGLAYSSVSNTLFVADFASHRILVFDVASIVDGEDAIAVIGQTNFTNNSFGTTQNKLFYPSGLAYGSASNTLFVADLTNSRVLVFSLTDLPTTDASAIAVIGQTNFTNSSNNHTQTTLAYPRGLAYNSASNTLYVADTNNNRVLVYNINNLLTTSTPASAVIGQTNFNNYSSGPNSENLFNPKGFAFNYTDRILYISDTGNNRVLLYNIDNIYPTSTAAYAVIGQSALYETTAATAQNRLNSPAGITYNGASNTLFVSDSSNNRVLVFDASGLVSDAQVILGQDNYTSSFINKNGPKENSLSNPLYSTIDSVNHRLFVSDAVNNRVLVFDLDANNNFTSNTASAVIGQADFTSYTSGATDINLNSPAGIFYNSASNTLFVADSLNNRVLVYDINNLLTTSTPAVAVIGQADFTSYTSGATDINLNFPFGISYNSASNTLFVADSLNNRVLVYDINNLLTTSTPAVAVIGQSDFVSGGSSRNQFGLFMPRGLAYGSVSSTLFVSDTSNNRVLVYDINNLLTTSTPAVAVIGQADFDSYFNATSQTGLYQPVDVAYDDVDNSVFVSDSYNSRVLIYDINNLLTTSTPAVAVIGQSDFVSGGGGTSQTKLSYQTGIAYNSTNNSIYVTDTGAHRVLEFNFVYISNPSNLSTTTVGSVYPTTTISAFNNQGTLSLNLFSGVLPNGLNFDSDTGVISGTPSEAVTSTFTIEARDTFMDGSVFINRKIFTITSYAIIAADPILPTISSVSTSTLTISWDANGNPTSTVYQIVGDNGFVSVTTTATSTLLTGLVPGTQYIFGVESQNPGDNSYNSPVNVTASYTLPVAPALSVNNFTSSTANINFVSIVGSASTTYAFALSTGGPGFLSASGTITSTAIYQTSSTWGNNTTVFGLTPKTAYTFFAIAKNGDGVTSTNGITYGEYTSSSDPTSPIISSVSTSSMMLSWEANNNPTNTVYRINGDNGFVSVTTTAASSSLTSLTPNTSYTFNVQSKNNDSSYNSTISATVTTTLANIPTSVLVAANSISQITVSWSGDATEYYLENVTAGTNSGWIAATSSQFSSLTCGTNYLFRVKGRNSALVETDFSGSVSGTTNSCPVSGGGGGGFSTPPPSRPAVVAPVILTQNFTITGSTEIKVGNVFHKVQIDGINLLTNEVSLTIQSTPMKFTLKINEEKVLDTDGDKQNDIKVKLNSISSIYKTVNLTIISIPDLQFTINNLDSVTAQRDVVLRFNSPDAKEVAISESENFVGGSFIPYKNIMNWKLSGSSGEKRLYVKFRTAQGGERAVYSSIKLSENYQPVMAVAPTGSVLSDLVFSLSNPDSKVVILPFKKLIYTPNSTVAYTYTFKNETGKILKIKILRQVIDANGKVVNKVNSSVSITKNKIFKSYATNHLSSNLVEGNYTVKVTVMDTKGNTLGENSFDVTVKKLAPVVKKPVVKTVAPALSKRK